MEPLRRSLLSPKLVMSLLVIAMVGLIREGYELNGIANLNRLIEHPDSVEVTEESLPELIYSRAFSYQGAGQPLEAIRLYGTLLQRGSDSLRARVHYNLGTLYLQDAAKLWKSHGLLEYARVTTLLGAAKEHLQESIRLDPGHWDARYNLEYVFRIMPPPKEKPKADFQGSKSSVFATLPALPGGGP